MKLPEPDTVLRSSQPLQLLQPPLAVELYINSALFGIGPTSVNLTT
jgi:hypothetical protein